MKTIHFEEIDSTCKYIDNHFEELEDMSFVSASFQSAGLGRGNRNWAAIKGENLLFSYLLKRPGLSEMFPYLSFLSAKVVLEEAEKLGIKNGSIKWPNDVYADGKKFCGILLTGKLPFYLETGIGINVNQTSFESGNRIPPTSLALELGKKVDLEAFKKSVFSSLERQVNHFDPKEIVSFVSKHNYLLNEEISYLKNGIEEKGKVIGIGEDCGLLIEKEGKIESLFSGEVSLIKKIKE